MRWSELPLSLNLLTFWGTASNHWSPPHSPPCIAGGSCQVSGFWVLQGGLKGSQETQPPPKKPHAHRHLFTEFLLPSSH